MPSSPEGAVMDRSVHTPTQVIEPTTAANPVDAVEQDNPQADASSQETTAKNNDKDQVTADTAPSDEKGSSSPADSDQDRTNANEASATNNEDGKVIMQEITKKEVELVGEHILQVELASFGKIIAGKSESEINTIIASDSTGKMKALNELFWAHGKNPVPIPKDGDTPFVTFTRKGPSGSSKDVQIEILGVTEFRDGKFICTARIDGTERPGQSFTQEEVQTALLTKAENLKAIIASLPKEQKEAFQLYVDMKKNGGILPAGTSQEEAQRILAESAESIGLITGEDLKMMLESHFSRCIASAGADVAKVQKLKDDHKSILEDKGLSLDGVIIADGSILARIFARTGAVSPQSIDLVIEDCSREISKIREKLEDKKLPISERKELEKELVTVELEKKLTSASKGATSEDEVSKSLDKMMKSGVDLKSFRDAVRTADTDTVIDFIFRNNPTLKEVSDEIKHKHRQELKRKLGKTGGLMALAMAIMMYTAMKGEGKGQ